MNSKILKRIERLEKNMPEKIPMFEIEYFDGTKEKASGLVLCEKAVKSMDGKAIKAIYYEKGQKNLACLAKALCGKHVENDEYPLLVKKVIFEES